MPDMTPVGNTIQPPNTLNAFANVVALKGEMQKTQQLQQQNEELTALHQFTQKAMQDPTYRNKDGSLNVQKFQQDASTVAPVYGQAYIGQATANANEGIANRTAILNLSNKQRETIGGFFGQVAAKPDASKADFLDAVEQAREQSDDPMYQRSLDSALLHAPQTHTLNAAQESQVLRGFSRSVAMQFNSPNTAESAPQMGTVQAPGGIQPYQSSPQSPLGIGPIGQPLKQGIAPQIVTQPGTGAPNVVGPGGQASPITQAGGGQQGTNWWNPAPGQLNFLTAQTQGVAQRAQAGIAAAQSSPQAIDALNRAGAILEQGTWTGTAFSNFKDLKNLAASLGVDTSSAQNASELAKNLARFEAARAGTVGDTDAARSLYEAGAPNTKMDADAVRAVVHQSLANERIIQAYSNLMETAPTPQIAMQRETAFRSIPNLLQTFELGQMKSKNEVDAFLKRYNISGAELSKSRDMLQQLGIQ